jgi:metal-responsive CopG/Arc/MetJ family transcriptional regulator
MKQTVSITIDKKLLKLIDKKRGAVKRSTFIEELIKKSLGVSK